MRGKKNIMQMPACLSDMLSSKSMNKTKEDMIHDPTINAGSLE